MGARAQGGHERFGPEMLVDVVRLHSCSPRSGAHRVAQMPDGRTGARGSR
jgi:hypothetical protein